MQNSLHTELELLNGLAESKRFAVEEVYNAHYPTVTKWIISHGGQNVDAADIYQEAITVLYEKAQDEEFRLTCKIGTYLFAIAKNLWYKKVRDVATVEISEFEASYEDDINAHIEREQHYEQLDDALEELGEPCRSLLKAFYHKGKSMQEIAIDFEYTNPNNAKTQKYKCLARLRKLFFSTQVKQ